MWTYLLIHLLVNAIIYFKINTSSFYFSSRKMNRLFFPNTSAQFSNQNQATMDAKKTATMQEELRGLLETWEHENGNNQWDVNPILKRMSEMLEEATNDYLQQNPDPMDERHPIKTHPFRPLGHLLKMIIRNEIFLGKLVITYLIRENTERNVLAARLMLNLLPAGIITNDVFKDAAANSLFTQLFRWAESSDSRELRSYSMALLGAGMGAEQAHQYRQNNFTLIPIALQRLRDLYTQMIQQYQSSTATDEPVEQIGPTNFAQFHQEEQEKKTNAQGQETYEIESEQNKVDDGIQTTPTRKRYSERGGGLSPPPKRSISLQHLGMAHPMVSPSADSVVSTGSSIRDAWNMLNSGPVGDLGDSNSSWRRKMQPILVGTHQLYPLTIEMEQRLIFHYLTPTSEYQDNVSVLLENHALNVALNYLAMDGPNHVCRDIRLLFDAIRYISVLLMHRKFAWEFVQGPMQGIQQLLRINRESMALTAVATCLYYLAYSTDIMEKVCHLPDHVLYCIMDYALYSLDHSHDSGRSSIAMFLGYSLHFRPILDRFDQRDGLRRLYNYCSTLKIMQKDDNTEEDSLDEINDEHYTLNILTLRNAIFAFKCYLQSHLFLKMEHMKRSHQSAGRHHHQLHRLLPQIPHTIPSQSHPHSKPMSMDDETERNCLEYLIQSQCMLQANNQNWKPIEEMRNLGIFQMLFRIINNYPDWLDYERQGRAETLKLALDVLRLSTVSPKVMLDACDTLIIKKTPTQGLSMILELADGEILDDSQIQRSSLEILINCLCNPIERGNINQNFPLELVYRFGKDFGRDILPEELAGKFPPIDSSTNLPIIEPTTNNSLQQIGAIRNQRANYPQPPALPIDNKAIKLYLNSKQIQQILWKCAQQNNAIMILVSLLHKKEPPTDADNLRELACHALNGIARYEPIRQILSKLPIIAANELNALMQSPVLIEKRMEHNRFCEQARQLIELVSQTKLRDFATMEMTQENLWRAAVVSQTRIKFNEKELLQLIYQHLADKGYKRTAKQLVMDAELPNIPASRIPSTPASLPGFPRQNESTFANIIARRCLFKNNNHSSPSQSTSLRLQPVASTSTAVNNNKPNTASSSSNIITGHRLPIKLHSTPLSSSNTGNGGGMIFSNTSFTTPLSSSANTASTAASFALKMRPRKSLSEIVQSYFRNEHAICRNPVANCPPFSLFYPHRCPEPKLLYSAPVNFVSRLQCRSNLPYRCSMETLRQADRRLVYSRFRHWKTFSEENELITCCQFSQNDEHIFLGTYAGDMFVYNVRTGAVDANYNCNQSAITAIHTTKNNLMLTSSIFVKPYSVLWRMDESGISVEGKLVDFNDDHYLEFGNLSTHQIVGTQGPKAVVYDTETAQPIVSLFEERLANHYTRNRAYFDPLDELVLNDGILFDPRIGQYGRVVHKFDKMNLDNSGVFHPRGTEIIINREIWDLRTHRLLHTVPALDQCKLAFNSTGTILFGIVHQPDPSDVDDRLFAAFGNYFRTLDANNYEVISTYEIKRPLLDLCCSHSDNYIGVIETGRIHEDTNFLKLYEVGRRRDREADEDEDDDADQNQDDDDEEENDGYTSSGSTTTPSIDSFMTMAVTVRDGDDENNEPADEEVEAVINENEEEMEDEEEDTDDDDDSSYSDEDYVELSSDDFSS